MRMCVWKDRGFQTPSYFYSIRKLVYFLNSLIITKFFADVGWWKRLRHCLLSSSRCLCKWECFRKNSNLVKVAPSSISSINDKRRYGWDFLCGWRRCVLVAALIGCLFCVNSPSSLTIYLFRNVILSCIPY